MPDVIDTSVLDEYGTEDYDSYVTQLKAWLKKMIKARRGDMDWANRILDQAEAGIQKGLALRDLPFYGEAVFGLDPMMDWLAGKEQEQEVEQRHKESEQYKQYKAQTITGQQNQVRQQQYADWAKSYQAQAEREHPLQTEQQIYYPFLESMATGPEATLSPAMKQYFTGQAGNISREFETETGPNARQEWWEKTFTPALIPGSPEFMREVLPGAIQSQKYETNKFAAANPGYGGLELSTPGNPIMQDAQQLAILEDMYAQAQSAGETPKTEDPLTAYLKKYPYLQKYYAMSPKQRGYYSSEFAPQTRFLRY